MKKIRFLEFLHKNQLKLSDFSAVLKDKVKIFKKMNAKLKYLEGEDHELLLSELKELDLEIKSEMLEELDGDLQNNDVLDVPEMNDVLASGFVKLNALIPELPKILQSGYNKAIFKVDENTFEIELLQKNDPQNYELRVSLTDQNGEIQPGVSFDFMIDYAAKKSVALKHKFNAHYKSVLAPESDTWSELPEEELDYSRSLAMLKWIEGLVENDIKLVAKRHTPKSQDENEKVVEQFVDRNKNHRVGDKVGEVLRSVLLKNGFRGDLSGREYKVGKYRLKRKIGYFLFNIELIN